MANRQIGWSTESNLLWQIGNQIDRMTGVIGSTLSIFVPQSRTLTINGVTYDLSANRSWTVSSDNIYTANGTLTADRTVTSNGNSLTILGGKELIAGEQTGLIIQTSATNIGQVGLNLNNTFTTTGKSWRLRSLSGGDFDIVTGSSTRPFYATGTGRVAINGTTLISDAVFSVNGVIGTSGGIQIQGGTGTPTGAGIEIEYNGGTSYFTSYNRTGGAWLPIIIRGSQIDLFTNGSNRARLTSAGRLLLGTTTESTFILDVNGTARVSGQLTTTTADAQFGAVGAATGSFRIDGVNGAAYAFSVYSSGVLRFGVVGYGGITTNNNSLDCGTSSISARTATIGGFGGENTTLDLYAQSGVNPATFKVSSGTIALKIFASGNTVLGGGTDNASALLNLSSTQKGFLPPRMTAAQRTAISSPAVGLIVYCTDATEGLYIYKSTGWTFVI